jgi:hypothetical protein
MTEIDTWEPHPGEMHPVDQAFYDLAIKERDFERNRYDRLEREKDEFGRQVMEVRVSMEIMRQQHDLCFNENKNLKSRIAEALNMLGMTQCPYYDHQGKCETGCHQEPECQTDQPTEGVGGGAIKLLLNEKGETDA